MVDVTQADRDAAAKAWEQAALADLYHDPRCIGPEFGPEPHDAEGILAQAFAAHAARAREEGYRDGIEAAAKAMEADAMLCDCNARSEGECACGAWDDWKTVPVQRMVELVRALDPAKIAGGE